MERDGLRVGSSATEAQISFLFRGKLHINSIYALKSYQGQPVNCVQCVALPKQRVVINMKYIPVNLTFRDVVNSK
jgi:hypothetical protein